MSPPTSAANPWYYVDNFEFVLRWVGERHDDLLVDAEKTFIQAFLSLPLPSKGLLARMVMRKGSLFRKSRLRYAEIPDIDAAASPLTARGWVDAAPTLTIAELFRLFTRPELARLFARPLERAGLRSARKDVQLAFLTASFAEPRSLEEWMSQADLAPDAFADAVYREALASVYERFRLMFFGNLHQDWSEFVLADLGLFRYETVAFEPSSRSFTDREAVDQYLHLHECRSRLRECTANGADPETCTAELAALRGTIPASPLRNEWAEWRRSKLLFQLGRHLERRQEWNDAHECYARSAYPGARARRARVLERKGDLHGAAEIAQLAARRPESDAEAQQIARMLRRLQRGPRTGPVAPRRAVSPEQLELVLPEDGNRVEEQARAALQSGTAPVFYVENVLMNALFGLLCWDTIFSAIPGAFFHPFQSAPADLLLPGFRSRRGDGFDRHLTALARGEHHDGILRNFATKAGVQSPFVAWSGLSRPLLDLALHCIPALHLSRIFERMLDNIRENCSGFPDLVQFWPAEARYRMVEVKGPGDRLQDNQRRWLDFFCQHDIPVGVCHVRRTA